MTYLVSNWSDVSNYVPLANHTWYQVLYFIPGTWYSLLGTTTILRVADIHRPDNEHAHLTSASDRYSRCAAALAFALFTRSVRKPNRAKGALLCTLHRAHLRSTGPCATTSGFDDWAPVVLQKYHHRQSCSSSGLVVFHHGRTIQDNRPKGQKRTHCV